MTILRVQYQALAEPVLPPVPSISWLPELGRPLARIGIAAALVASGCVLVDQAAAAPSIGWHQALSTPTAPRPALAAAAQSAFIAPPTVTQPSDYAAGWDAALSLPPGARPGLPAAQQAAFAGAPPAAAVAVTSVDRYLQPLAGPVLQIRGLGAAYQQSLAYWPGEIGTVDKWFLPLSAPTLSRAGPATADQPALSFVSVETVTADKWLQPWSVAPPARPGLPASNQVAFTSAPAAGIVSSPPSSWNASFAAGPIVKTGIPAAEQQALAFVPAVSTPEVITVDKWYSGLSGPPKDKPGLAAHQQQSSAISPAAAAIAIPSIDRWFVPLAVPHWGQRAPCLEPVEARVDIVAPPPLVAEPPWTAVAPPVFYTAAAPALFYNASAPPVFYTAAAFDGDEMDEDDRYPDLIAGVQIATVGYDFGQMLAPGETLTGTPSVGISVVYGDDTEPRERLAAPTIGTISTTQNGTGLTDTSVLVTFDARECPTDQANDYLLVFSCAASDGTNLPARQRKILVKPPG